MTKSEQIKTLLCQFLDQAQKTFAVHKRCMKSFKKLYHVDHDVFKEELIKQINRILVIFKREPAVERLVQFIVSACVYTNDTQEKEADNMQEDENPEDDESSKSKNNKKKGKKNDKTKEVVKQTKKSRVDDEPLATSLLKYLLQLTNVKDKAVRFRSTQIIAGLISNLEEIDNSLWDDIEERMMDRVHDKYPSVRCQAVIALSRLQDPRNPKDVVVAEYVHLLKVDSSKDVRKAVLSSIGLTKLTVTDVLNRTRDVNEDVRKHAFTIFASKVPVEKLSIDHRATLLRDGLNDRVEMVRKAAVDMIGFWLKRVKNDPIQLLTFLDVEQNEEVAEKAVKEMLKMVENPETFLDWNLLDNEKAIYARVYCSEMKSKKNDEKLEEILPEISKFCQIMPQYLNNEFIAKQLFAVAKLFDFADEVGRRNLNALVCKLLCSRDISSDLRKVILKLLRRMNPDEDEFIRYVLEILSEIQDPLETSVKWERESTQKDMWLSCLAITEDLLQNTRKTLADPGLAGLLQSVILPAIQHPSPDVRNAAVRCLGLFCLLSKEEARTHLLLFVQIVKNDRDLIKLATMRVLFDLLLVFGNSLLDGQEMDNVLSQEPSQILSQSTENLEAKTPSPIYSVLNSFLNSTNEDLLTTSVEGLAKLFVTDVFDSPKIISKLLLLFFDPATEEMVRLRQCLSVFFPLYTSQSEKHRQTLKAGFLTATRTILFASKRTMSSINLVSIAQFVLFLLSSKDHKGGPYHDSLCLDIVDEIVSSEEAISKQLVKCLGLFELTKNTPQETIKLLRANSDWMMKEFSSDKTCSKILEKFDATLKALDSSPNDPIDPQLIKKVEENTFKYRQEQIQLQKENKAMNYDPQTEKIVQKQIDYFNEVDDFKLPGLIPDKKKRKTPASWEQEREKIMKEKAQLAKELNKLRRMLENKEKTGQADIPDASDIEDKSDAERIPEEDKSDAEEIPLQNKKQKVAPPTINLTKPKDIKPVAKAPPPAKQEAKSPAPTSILKRKIEVPTLIEDTTKRTKTVPPAKPAPSKPEVVQEAPPTKAKPIPVDLSTNVNNNNETNAGAVKADKTEKVDKTEKTDKTEKSDKTEKVDKTDKSDKGAPLSKRRRMASKKSSMEDEELQPIPEITGLVPSTPIIGTKKTAPQAGKLPESKIKKVVVSFSGFKPDDKIMKDDIIDRVLLLGGEVRLGEVFDSKITHVVSPPNSRTMKTLAASLTSRWIVSPQWILDSTAAGYFVDETNYGRRKNGSALEGKKFYISENFKKENHDKNFKESNYKALIVQLGRGIIVSDMKAADYSLVATGETKSHGVALTWNAFFDLIQNQSDEVVEI